MTNTMKPASFCLLLAIVLFGTGLRPAAAEEGAASNTLTAAEKAAGWQALFDGRTLAGWKASENPESFTVRDGMIIAQGRGAAIEAQAPHPKCHLFYMGPDGHASFTDFEFAADVKCEPKANSGIYFHSEFLPDAWPQKGFEIQIDNDPTHAKKSGSLYGVADITESPSRDNEWFHVHLTVRGKRRGDQDRRSNRGRLDRARRICRPPPSLVQRGKLAHGTFALQGHDAESTVYFRNLRSKADQRIGRDAAAKFPKGVPHGSYPSASARYLPQK